MSEWRWSGIEPRLDEMLRDPIVRALMLRDGITDREVRTVVADAARARGVSRPRPLAAAARS